MGFKHALHKLTLFYYSVNRFYFTVSFRWAVMSSAERFHDAARKGDTEALRESTWKDYDQSDDKGMTAV